MTEYLAFFEQELRGRPDALTLSSPSQAQQLQALSRVPWVCAAMGPENTQQLLIPFLIDFQRSMKNRDQILASMAVQWRHVVNALLGRRCTTNISSCALSPTGDGFTFLEGEGEKVNQSSKSSIYNGGESSGSSLAQHDGRGASVAGGEGGGKSSKTLTSSRSETTGSKLRKYTAQSPYQQQISVEKILSCVSLVMKPLEELAAAEEKCVRNEAIVSILYLVEILPTYSSRQRLVREMLLPVATRLATMESGGFFCRCSAAKLLPALYPYAPPFGASGAGSVATSSGEKSTAPGGGGGGAAGGGGNVGGDGVGAATGASSPTSTTGRKGAATATATPDVIEKEGNNKKGALRGSEASSAGGDRVATAPEDRSTTGASTSSAPSSESSAPGGGVGGGGGSSNSRTDGNGGVVGAPTTATTARSHSADGESACKSSSNTVDADMEDSSSTSSAAEIDRAVLRDLFEKLLTHDAVLVRRDALAEVPSFAKHWLRVRTQQQLAAAAGASGTSASASGFEKEAAATVTLFPLYPQGVEDFFFPILARQSVDSSDFLRCAAVSSLIQLARLYPPNTPSSGDLSGTSAGGASSPSYAAVAGGAGAGGGSSGGGGNTNNNSSAGGLVLSSPLSAGGADSAGGALNPEMVFSAQATLPIFSSAGADSSWRVRAVVAKALPHIVPLFREQLAAMFVPLLQQLIRDSALRDVRQEAIRAVGKLAPSLSPAEVSQHLVPLIPVLMQENTATAAAPMSFSGSSQPYNAVGSLAGVGGAGVVTVAPGTSQAATAFFQAGTASSVAASFPTSVRGAAATSGGGGSSSSTAATGGGVSTGSLPSATAATFGINSNTNSGSPPLVGSNSGNGGRGPSPPTYASSVSMSTGTLAGTSSCTAATATGGNSSSVSGNNTGGATSSSAVLPATTGLATTGSANGDTGGASGPNDSSGSLTATTGGNWTAAAEAPGNSNRISLAASTGAASVSAGLAIPPAMPVVAPPTLNSPLIAASPLLLPVIQAALPVAKAAGPGGLESILSCLANLLFTREELHIRLQIAHEAGEFCRLAAQRSGCGATTTTAAVSGDSVQQTAKRGGGGGGAGRVGLGSPPSPLACPEALKLVDGLTTVLQSSMGGSEWTLRVEIVRQIAPIAQAFGERFFTEHLQGVFHQTFADYVYDVREATVDVAQSLTEHFGWAWAEAVVLPRLKQIYFGNNAMASSAAARSSTGGQGSSSSRSTSGTSPRLPQAPAISYLERITVLHAIPKLAQVITRAEVETHLLPFLAASLQDSVPNVKLTGAETIRVMLAADLLPTGGTFTKELLPSLRQLVADGDFDVRFYAQLALMACKT